MLTSLLLKWRAAFGMGARVAKILLLGASAAVGTAHAQTPAPWPFAGGGLENSRARLSPAGPQQLNSVTASKLNVKWSFNSQGAITATPTVEQGGLYVTDFSGMLYKIDPDTGVAIWSHPISFYTGATGGGLGSRSSPAIGSQGEIVVGDTNSAAVFAVNRTTGQLIWKTVVDAHSYALIHGSAVIYNGIVYIGVGSREEGVTRNTPDYVPTFRGSVVALNEATGKVLWKFYTAPPNYSGAAIWNTQPVVFTAAKSLIVATGNNYSVPPSVATCVLNSGSTRDIQAREGVKCLDPADQVDAVVSLDLITGHFNWSRRVQGPDTFNKACLVGLPSCPNPQGKDADFASSPNLVNVPDFVGVSDDRGGASKSYLLGAVQNNGNFWALNPYNGGLFWGTFVGTGGIKWGTAVNIDNNTEALIAVNNGSDHDPHVYNLLAGVNGVTQYWNAGSWGSINLKTGKMIWQLPLPAVEGNKPPIV